MGFALICLGTLDLLGVLPGPIAFTQNLVAAAGGLFLLAGLWTPVTGALVAIDELWIALSRHFSQQAGQWIHILLAVLMAAVAMLGPGAWSIDARLFGRKRFDIGDRTRGNKTSP
jgi:putative oxidoreductase